MSEYTHNDDVADLLRETERLRNELQDAKTAIKALGKRIETIRTAAFYATEELLYNGL